jgi:hypothetical protein
VDFEFSAEERAFVAGVRAFLEAERAGLDAADVMAPQREADAMLADSPARRAFMRRLAEAGYLGMSWDPQYGGQGRPGLYDYLLNEELASVGAPLIGKGVGCIGKTLIRHGSERLKRKFLPRILAGDIEFALGYSEPGAGSDLASLALRARRDGDEWVLDGQKMWTTSAHFADWYWVAARTDPAAPKHKGISVFLVPMDHPGLSVTPIRTMGDHRTNQVFFDGVRVDADYLVGRENEGWTYICEALDYERFTLYTVGPLRVKFEALCELLRVTTRDGKPLAADPAIRARIARLAAALETAGVLQRRVIAAAMKDAVPTVEAAMCKLYSTELGRRMADVALEALGPEGLLMRGAEGAPADGRWEHSWRATVVDTIGGGSSEVQRNIIARRGLGLPLT